MVTVDITAPWSTDEIVPSSWLRALSCMPATVP
jgi:hypothetical protein